MKKRLGFTLVELLIVIGVIAILAAIIFEAVDPARRFAEARNAERWSSVNAILNGVLKFTVDERGTLPADLAAASAGLNYMIGTCASGANSQVCSNGGSSVTLQAACVDLNPDLVDNYLASMPVDSSASGAGADYTFYYITKSANGRITVGTCNPEAAGGSTPTISVSR